MARNQGRSESITIKVPPELKEHIERQAEAEGRTVSAYLCRVLQQVLLTNDNK